MVSYDYLFTQRQTLQQVLNNALNNLFLLSCIHSYSELKTMICFQRVTIFCICMDEWMDVWMDVCM